MTQSGATHREAPAAPPPRRSRWSGRRSRWVGAVLLACGLALVAHLVWQVSGTTWVAERRQAETLRELERAWSAGGADVAAGEGRAGAVLRVPRFGRSYAVPVVAGTTEEDLAAGVGLVEGSADIGGRGNVVLAGHRITQGEPFADLPLLRAGDRVLLETRSSVHTYVLDTDAADLVVDAADTWVLDDAPRNPDPAGPGPSQRHERLLTLTTCAEIFHTDDRTVAFGHLESVRPRR